MQTLRVSDLTVRSSLQSSPGDMPEKIGQHGAESINQGLATKAKQPRRSNQGEATEAKEPRRRNQGRGERSCASTVAGSG